MTLQRDPVLIVVNNDYEKRYFYSAVQAVRGLGWFNWPKTGPLPHGHGYSWNGPGAAEVQVYRLDVEATHTLMNELLHAPRDHDPSTGKWLPRIAKNFQTIIQNCTGIKEK